MNDENLSFEEMLAQQGEGQQQQQGFEAPIQQQVQLPQQVQGDLQNLKNERTQLRQKVSHALRNDYEGYRLDTDGQGNAFFGTKGYASLEADKLHLEDLKERIDELEREQQQFQNLARQSTSSASQLAKRIYQEKINFVNKSLQADVTDAYQRAYAGVDWSVPQLHSEAAKESLLKMMFNHAAQETLEAHRRKNTQRGPGSMQDADTGHLSSDEQERVETNEYGHAKGTLEYEISERFKQRQSSSGVAADVYRKQREGGRR